MVHFQQVKHVIIVIQHVHPANKAQMIVINVHLECIYIKKDVGDNALMDFIKMG
jgi:hypothetical protein